MSPAPPLPRTRCSGAPPRAGAPAVRVGSGPRLVEAALLDRIDAFAARVEGDPALLAAPLRVVVPSRSLRDHVIAAALAARGRPLVGVLVEPLFGLALEVLARSRVAAGAASPAPRVSRPLAALEVERRIASHPALARALEGVRGGAASVASTVDDLLDAGFERQHADAFDDALNELAGGAFAAPVERARAIGRLALELRAALAGQGFAHRSDVLLGAAGALRAHPRLLPASEVVVHGFAEATGAATDLLAALAEALPLTLLLDEPPEPGGDGAPDPASRFAHRLRDALAKHAAPEIVSAAPASAGELAAVAPDELLEARGREGEVRAVAARIRALLDSDPSLAPERIGVVARQPGGYARHVRTHFARLGIPFSGVAMRVPAGVRARRAAAIGALLEQRESCPVDRWLDALAFESGDGDGDASAALPRAELADARLALRVLGAARLSDVAALAAATSRVELPVRRGVAVQSADDEGDATGAADGENVESDAEEMTEHVSPRRSVSAERIAHWIERAKACSGWLAAWRDGASADAHAALLRELVTAQLGWTEEHADALAAFARDLPGGLALSRDEVCALASASVEGALASEALGGAGGGVAVLSAMEARARTFSHLFVLGLERGVFPRVVREDALLPDALRRPLARDVLPDLPIKATGHDEERYLFAQLAAASANVVLCAASESDDGKRRVRSAFLDRLLGSASPPARVPVAAPYEAPRGDAAHTARTQRTPRDWAIAAGASGDRAAWKSMLATALADGGGSARSDAPSLAAARARIVDELAPALPRAELGPYLGCVGALVDASDPRRRSRHVTSLERTARCGWQSFLERLLHLEVPPDPIDRFPELDALRVGSVVHTLLERALASGSWPGERRLEELALSTARAALEGEGRGYDGLARVLAERARAAVARARELLGDQALDVLGVEVAGSVAVGSARESFELGFRADLVERASEGVRLVDFKTGKSFLDVKSAEHRAQKLANRIARGLALQAQAYALGAVEVGGARLEAASGRYVFLGIDPGKSSQHVVDVARGDSNSEVLEAAFARAAAALEQCWRTGVFAPRLSRRAATSNPCDRCELRDACSKGDVEASERQDAWVRDAAARAARGESLDPLSQAYLAHWMLPGESVELAAPGEAGADEDAAEGAA